MRTPNWESSAGATAALLNNGTQHMRADVYTITLSGGLVIRWTSADVAITVAGVTWTLGPLIERGRTRIAIGVAVDTLDIKLQADTSVTVNGVPLMQFLGRRGFDGARVLLERVYFADFASGAVGKVALFSGRVSQIKPSRSEATITVTSDLELLDVKLPLNVYQPGCLNTVYDSTCGASRAAATVAGTVTTGTGAVPTAIGASLGKPDGWFDLGVITFTSGACNGVSRTVKTSAGGVITFIQPLPAQVVAGDTFSIYPGCDKTQATCASKFNNAGRFRGFPFIPVPETPA